MREARSGLMEGTGGAKGTGAPGSKNRVEREARGTEVGATPGAAAAGGVAPAMPARAAAIAPPILDAEPATQEGLRNRETATELRSVKELDSNAANVSPC